MKKEINELHKMIMSINQDSIRPNTSPTLELRTRKDLSEHSKAKESLNASINKIFQSNWKLKEIYHLININAPIDSSHRYGKGYSPYASAATTKPIQQTKAQKKFTSVMYELYPKSFIQNKSFKKATCQLKRNAKRPSIQKSSNNVTYNKSSTIICLQEPKRNSKVVAASKYTLYLTSNDLFKDNKNPAVEYQRQGFPINDWFNKQQEKYKNAFYQEKTNNIRSLVSITDNKEHRITNNFYRNRNLTANTTTTKIYDRNPMRDGASRGLSCASSYDTALDNFSNRLFKGEPLHLRTHQFNEPPKYFITSEQATCANASSFKKDSLITNYNKILQHKAPIKKLY